MRYITPILLIGASVAVHLYNAEHTDRVLLFPFIDVIVPATKGDLLAQGQASVYFLAGVGGLLLVVGLLRDIRERALRREVMDD